MEPESVSDFVKRIPEKLKIWIKSNSFLLLIIALNILLHLPRTSHMRGNDAYTVVWMAQAMSEGWFEAWTINPLSFFGYFPYSKYPIGGILILTLFLKMGMSIDLAVYMFSALFVILGIVSSYFLGKTLFKDDKKLAKWFMLFYTLSPIFIDLTNWTASLRGPFLSLLPLSLAFLIRFVRKPNLLNSICMIASSLLLLLMHALFIGYLIYIFATIFTFFVPILLKLLKQRKAKISDFFTRYKLYIILFIYVSFLITSIFVIEPRGWAINYFTQKPVFIQTLNQNKFTQIILVILNYAISEYGFISLLFVLGILTQFKNSYFKEKKDISLYFILSGFFLVWLVPYLDYGPIFMFPWICFYATLSIRFLRDRLKQKKKLLPIVHFWIVSLIFLQRIGLSFMSTLFLILLSVGLLIVLLFSIYEIFMSKSSKFHVSSKIVTAVVILLVFNLTIFTSLDDYGNTFPTYSLSEDEIEIANYLKQNNLENKIIVSYNIRIARRIQAFGFQPIIPSENPPSMLYYNYLYLDKNYIISSTEFIFSNIFRYGTPYITNTTSSIFELYTLYAKSLELDLRNSSGYNTAVNVYNIGYVLLSTNSSENIPMYDFSSLLFESVIETGIMRVETTNLVLYELSPP